MKHNFFYSTMNRQLMGYLLLILIGTGVSTVGNAQETSPIGSNEVSQESIKQSSDGNLSWDELTKQYSLPKWLTEARFGIWVHWGAQTEPEYGGGWYARHMYMQDVGKQQWGKNAYPYQIKHYGHPSEKGFKDVIHEWKADKLDTDKLLKYFSQDLGAKYFVALANHHDHFDNFDSTYQPWNSVNIGPKRDLIGEFSKSAKKYHIPFGVSSHDDRFMDWWLPAFGSDKSGPLKGVPYDGHLTKKDGKGKWWEGLDPADLYGLPPELRTPEWIQSVKENWVRRTEELVTKYDVDFLWFDGYGFPYGKYGKEVCTYFYNLKLKQQGKIEAVVSGKMSGESAVFKDIERGGADKILSTPWQGTCTFSSWFYKKDKPSRQNARTVIQLLVDMNSKNGNLLLNVELLPDGTIPFEHKKILDKVGQWIHLNSEAIYGSKPWVIYGDNLASSQEIGKSKIGSANAAQLKKKSADFNNRTVDSAPYPSNEVRFVTHGNTLYMFVMNPKAGDIEIPSLGLDSKYGVSNISSIKLLGGKYKINYKQEADELKLTVPVARPTDYTAVFEIKGAL